MEEVEGGCALETVPAEDAFSFVQRLAREYAKIKDGDHQSVRRVLQRAYLAALKMQREPDEFARLQADPFWKASFYKPEGASTSKWVVRFIMQARTLMRALPRRQVRGDPGRTDPRQGEDDDARVARMEGVEAAYAAVQGRQRLRASKLFSGGKVGADQEGDVSASDDEDLLLRCRHSGPTRSGGIGIPVVFKEHG